MWLGTECVAVATRADTRRRWLEATAEMQAAKALRKSEERCRPRHGGTRVDCK
jgi:hypothetical protein